MMDDDEPANHPWNQGLTELELAIIRSRLQGASAKIASSRKLFGEALYRLIDMGIAERNARMMLGRWRKDSGDEAVADAVTRAWEQQASDPVAYITKTLSNRRSRTNRTEQVMAGGWTLVGWEAATIVNGSARFQNGTRGQVWRDPFGKHHVLPAPSGTVVPTIREDGGVDPQTGRPIPRPRSLALARR